MNNDELLIAIKDMFEEKVEEVKQHTGVLVEKLEGDIKAVAEGHSILDRKIDNLQNEMDRRFENVDRRFENIDRRFENIEKDMNIVKNYVIAVDTKLNEHEIILKRVK